MKIQIIDNETLLNKADFENCEVWLLNRTQTNKIDSRIINISELTESSLPNSEKFPRLFTEIGEKYFNDGIIPNDFDYEIITNNPDSFMVHVCVCDSNKLKVI